MAQEHEKDTKGREAEDEREEIPHRTGGQAEGEREDEDVTPPLERKRPRQAEG